VIAAFNDIQARTGTQKLWIGANEHYFVYASNFWRHDPYFEWFGHWLKGEDTGIIGGPAVSYSPRAWVEDRASYVADDWIEAERWPPLGAARDASICAATAACVRRGRAGLRAATIMTRAGRSRPWAGATC
jgi:hypothetical protein